MKRFLRALPLLLLLLVVGVWYLLVFGPKAARKQWKDRAIELIDQHSHDKIWTAAQQEEIRKLEAPDKIGWWASPEMLLMENDEWITFANACWKSDWRVGDIFIGRGSDDQWYYSSYHFCNGMIVAKSMPQPKSLEEFCTSYFLETFDGKSDDCFQKTVP